MTIYCWTSSVWGVNQSSRSVQLKNKILRMLLCTFTKWSHRKLIFDINSCGHTYWWDFSPLNIISSNCYHTKLPLEYSQQYQSCHHCCSYMLNVIYTQEGSVSCKGCWPFLRGQNNFMWCSEDKRSLFAFQRQDDHCFGRLEALWTMQYPYSLFTPRIYMILALLIYVKGSFVT